MLPSAAFVTGVAWAGLIPLFSKCEKLIGSSSAAVDVG